MTARYDKVTVAIRCFECREIKQIERTKNSRRRYCDECQPVVIRRRKKLEHQQRLVRVKQEKPRLVRYAGYDPSEHN